MALDNGISGWLSWSAHLLQKIVKSAATTSCNTIFVTLACFLFVCLFYFFGIPIRPQNLFSSLI